MAITKAPPRIHTAYNPQQIVANSPFTMSTVSPQVPTTIEIIDNQCDGQGVFQHAMSESRTYIAPEWVYYDHRVSGVYLIDATPYGVVNAVRQLYGDPDMSALITNNIAILNSSGLNSIEARSDNMIVYKVYEGYPIVINVITSLGSSVQLTRDDGVSAVIPEPLGLSSGVYNPPVASIECIPGGSIMAGTGTYSLELIYADRVSGVGPFSDIKYINGYFFGVATNWLARSVDGFSWSVIDLPLSGNSISYGNGVYVIVGAGGLTARSTDGVTWDAVTTPTNNTLASVTFGGGYFVATGGTNTGVVVRSNNGLNWTLHNIGVNMGSYAITYGGGYFVSVGFNAAQYARSADGATWTTGTLPNPYSVLYTVTYAQGIFIAGSVSAGILTSTDGLTWVVRNVGGAAIRITGIDYGDGVYIAVGGTRSGTHEEHWFSSTDGVTWVEGDISGAISFTCLGYGNGVFVAGGASGNYSVFDTVFTPDPGGLSISTQIIHCPFSDSQKLYVRWLNQNGGWDYQMFQINTRIQNRTTSQSVFEGYIEDIQNPENYLIVYDGESEFRAVTGSARLEKYEYDIIQYIHQSPIIERYDKTLDKWIRIRLVANAQNEWNKDTRFGEVAFTFILEPVQKQYPGL